MKSTRSPQHLPVAFACRKVVVMRIQSDVLPLLRQPLSALEVLQAAARLACTLTLGAEVQGGKATRCSSVKIMSLESKQEGLAIRISFVQTPGNPRFRMSYTAERTIPKRDVHRCLASIRLSFRRKGWTKECCLIRQSLALFSSADT